MASYERYKEYASLTAAELAAVNNIFPQGLLVVEADTGKMKVGDGTTAYNSLPYGPTTLSSLTLPSGTANGVLYLNGSKVVTSGSALTFDGTKLTVAATADSPTSFFQATNSTTGGNFSLNAAAGATQYAFPSVRGDTVLRAESNSLVFGTAADFKWGTVGAELMRLTSTGLGIGTSSPGSRIHGAVAANGTPILTVQNTSTSQSSYGILFDTELNNAGSRNWALISEYVAVGDFHIVRSNAKDGNPFSAGTSVLAIDSSGNLGLGVTPSAWVEGTGLNVGSGRGGSIYTETVNYGFTTFNANAYYSATDTWKYVTSNAASRYQQLNGVHSWHTAASGTAGNAISFTQAMTLDASGNLSVGTTITPTQITFVGTSGITYRRSTDDTFAGVLDYSKSRGSAASPTAVQNNDSLFHLRVAPYDGSTYTYLNSQLVQVDGTFTSGQNPPTRIVWCTNAANASATERLRLKAGGQLRFVPLAADPAGAEAGDVYYNSGTNKLRLYDGSTWVDLN